MYIGESGINVRGILQKVFFCQYSIQRLGLVWFGFVFGIPFTGKKNKQYKYELFSFNGGWCFNSMICNIFRPFQQVHGLHYLMNLILMLQLSVLTEILGCEGLYGLSSTYNCGVVSTNNSSFIESIWQLTVPNFLCQQILAEIDGLTDPTQVSHTQIHFLLTMICFILCF